MLSRNAAIGNAIVSVEMSAQDGQSFGFVDLGLQAPRRDPIVAGYTPLGN